MKGALGRRFFLLGGLLVAAGCGKTEMDSAWRTQEIAIDGRDGDWQGALAYVAREKREVDAQKVKLAAAAGPAKEPWR